MSALDGDNPCDDCGTTDNLIWFTEDVLWNLVVRQDLERRGDAILCIRCFAVATERRGFHPGAWRVLPEWPWREEVTP